MGSGVAGPFGPVPRLRTRAHAACGRRQDYRMCQMGGHHGSARFFRLPTVRTVQCCTIPPPSLLRLLSAAACLRTVCLTTLPRAACTTAVLPLPPLVAPALHLAPPTAQLQCTPPHACYLRTHFMPHLHCYTHAAVILTPRFFSPLHLYYRFLTTTTPCSCTTPAYHAYSHTWVCTTTPALSSALHHCFSSLHLPHSTNHSHHWYCYPATPYTYTLVPRTHHRTRCARAPHHIPHAAHHLPHPHTLLLLPLPAHTAYAPRTPPHAPTRTLYAPPLRARAAACTLHALPPFTATRHALHHTHGTLPVVPTWLPAPTLQQRIICAVGCCITTFIYHYELLLLVVCSRSVGLVAACLVARFIHTTPPHPCGYTLAGGAHLQDTCLQPTPRLPPARPLLARLQHPPAAHIPCHCCYRSFLPAHHPHLHARAAATQVLPVLGTDLGGRLPDAACTHYACCRAAPCHTPPHCLPRVLPRDGDMTIHQLRTRTPLPHPATTYSWRAAATISEERHGRGNTRKPWR